MGGVELFLALSAQQAQLMREKPHAAFPTVRDPSVRDQLYGATRTVTVPRGGPVPAYVAKVISFPFAEVTKPSKSFIPRVAVGRGMIVLFSRS